jgi:hypothetical protein
MSRFIIFWFVLFFLPTLAQKNRDPLKTQIITSDLVNFWKAMEKCRDTVDAEIIDKYYLNPGSEGVKGFMRFRIQSAQNLTKVINLKKGYYRSIKPSVDSIDGMKDVIRNSLVKLKDIYPTAIFPPVYFVVGALNSGGTSTSKGIIIGAEMFGLSVTTPQAELDNRLKTVLKPANQIPFVVAHELIHFQQKIRGQSLLAASIREGSADFLSELISGRHINDHVHTFANPMEKQLWEEFKIRMNETDYTGWLYSSSPGRPNDLGYWMGYKISKSYYDKSKNKQAAINEILNITDVNSFLVKSEYSNKFK